MELAQYQERGYIMDWISPLDFRAAQADVLYKVEPKGSTEESNPLRNLPGWFSSSEDFEKWTSGDNDSLVCSGLPASGKTIFATAIIQYLNRYYRAENVTIICIYCNHRGVQNHAIDLIAAILRQLVQNRCVVSDNIKNLYRKHSVHNTRPELEEISLTLQEEIKTYAKVFLVVDGLDTWHEEHLLNDEEPLLDKVGIAEGRIRWLTTSSSRLAVRLAENPSLGKVARVRLRKSYKAMEHFTDRHISSSGRLCQYLGRKPSAIAIADGKYVCPMINLGSEFSHSGSIVARPNRKVLI